MATRFYLPSVGPAPVTPPALPSGWVDQSPAHYNAPAPIAKSNTALTDISVTDSTNVMTNVAIGCYVSELLAAQSIAGTVSAVVMAFASVSSADDSLNVGVYLIAGDGSSVKSTLYAGHAEGLQSVDAVGVLGQEFDSVRFETRIIPATALTTQSAAAGDRLMILAGYRTHDVSATARASSLRVGDPSATADQALTADLITNLVPWVELSATLTFAGGDPEPSEVTLTPASLHLAAVVLSPQPGAVSVALTPAQVHLAAVTLVATPAAVTVALTPAAVHLAALALVATPGSVAVTLTPATFQLAAVALAAQPGPAALTLTPAVLLLVAPAVTAVPPIGEYVPRPILGFVERPPSGTVARPATSFVTR